MARGNPEGAGVGHKSGDDGTSRLIRRAVWDSAELVMKAENQSFLISGYLNHAPHRNESCDLRCQRRKYGV